MQRLAGSALVKRYGQQAVAHAIANISSGRITALLQTAAGTAYDTLRKRRKTPTLDEFVNIVVDTLLDPRGIFMDLLNGEVQRSVAPGYPSEPRSPAAPTRPEPRAENQPETPGRRARRTELETPAGPPAEPGKKTAARGPKTPEAAPALMRVEHSDFPNVGYDASIKGLDVHKILKALDEGTPASQRLADRIRSREVHVEITREELLAGYTGAQSGNELYGMWKGTNEATAGTLVHEEAHYTDPDRYVPGSKTLPMSSRLELESTARAFQFEFQAAHGQPPSGAVEHAYFDTLVRTYERTGDVRTARIAADKAVIQALRAYPAAYGVESATQELARARGISDATFDQALRAGFPATPPAEAAVSSASKEALTSAAPASPAPAPAMPAVAPANPVAMTTKTTTPKSQPQKASRVAPTKDVLRAEARDAFFKAYPRLRGRILEIHHRIPLEWRRIFPKADPNRLSNLQGLTKPEHLRKVSDLWDAFRATYKRLQRNPTQREVLEFAMKVDKSLDLPSWIPSPLE